VANRILVIGATGLLGEPVARHLNQHGYNVRLLVRAQRLVAAKNRFGDHFEVVTGDVRDLDSLGRALDGCFGVHISLSGEVEQTGVENVALVARHLALQRITYISGTSVAEENTWVPVMKRKFFGEKAIRESGRPYSIFCPTWFMEILPRYIRGGRATVFGKQPNPYHLVAAEDYARMVAVSYGLPAAVNHRYIIHGPEGILFHEAVKQYCHVFHPEIKKVTTMPYWLATLIALITGQQQMKRASDFMAAFEKTGERGDPTAANAILGAPTIRLEDWLRQKNPAHHGVRQPAA
jgi:uncharacterized protein YbjT (DUF2867 family)